MSDYTQNVDEIIGHQEVTNPTSVEGTPVNVATYLSCVVEMRHAYIEAVDPGGIEPKFYVMGSKQSSGDDDWHVIQEITCVDPGAAPATEAMTATEPVAEEVLAVASTTGFLAGNKIYIQDTTTVANSEWHLVRRIVSNTSIDIFNGLANQKDSADVIWGSAEIFNVPLDCSGLLRINVVYGNEGLSAPNTAIYALAAEATDIA